MKSQVDPLDLYRFNLSKRLLTNLGNQASLFKDTSILNIGSGKGRESRFLLSEKPKFLILLDINFSYLKYSRQWLSGPQRKFFLHANGCNLPFKDKSIDIISFVDTFHHVAFPEKVLKEALRVARKCIIVDEAKKGRLRNILNFIFIRMGVKREYEFYDNRECKFRFDTNLVKRMAEEHNLELIFYPYFMYYFEFYKNSKLKFIKYFYIFFYGFINLLFHRWGNRVIIILNHRF